MLLIILLISLSISLFSICIGTMSASAQSGEPPLFSPKDSPYGVPFEKWTQAWWKWDFSMNKTTHPNTNYTPEKCSNGQNTRSSVWFLSLPDPRTVPEFTRACTIPEGKAIMFAPPITGECDSGIKGEDTDEKIKQCAMAGNEGARMDVFLDGVKLDYPLQDNRITSNFFNVSFVKDNIVDSEPGMFRGIIDGWFVFFKPLSPGQHEFYYEAEVVNNPDSNFNFAQAGKYLLTVKK